MEELQDYDFYITTWNVLSSYRVGVLKHVKTELELYRIDTAAIQETRWRGSGVLDTGNSY